MSTTEKTDAEHMTGASAQRWEPADEGAVSVAANQSPPGSERRPERDKSESKPSEDRPRRDRERGGGPSRP